MKIKFVLSISAEENTVPNFLKLSESGIDFEQAPNGRFFSPARLPAEKKMIPYRPYSEFLRDRYGEKVYKLPVNIPCSCPNRDGTRGFGGCIFCGESGSGYELRDESETVTGQLSENADYIGKRYKAKKFIAYFQSFSNTWFADEDFKRYLTEAAAFPGVVGYRFPHVRTV